MKKDGCGLSPASKPSGDGAIPGVTERFAAFISVGVRTVGTSDAVTVLPVSMHQSMRPTGHPVMSSFDPGEDCFCDGPGAGNDQQCGCCRLPRVPKVSPIRRNGDSQLAIAPRLAAGIGHADETLP